MPKLTEFNLDMIDVNVKTDVAIKEIAKKDIAIIGIAAKMPSADNLAEYWDNIRNGIDCIRKIPKSRQEDLDDYLQYTNAVDFKANYIEAAYLEHIDQFDYRFFNLSPREASLMDPSQKLFLETVWQTIEDAGYGGGGLSGSATGIYVGFASSLKDCYQKIVHEVAPSKISMSWIGNLTAMIPSRISYLLDLTGPTMVIDTACSSALTAIHLAAQAIINGDCEMALAGGVKINLLPVSDDNLKFGVESSDYRTRSFAHNSDGTGMGEGVAAVLLKPLSKALKDRDHIYAVLKGSAINQDGSSMGLTVTNPVAQTNLLVKTWEKAGINPETISYIETHGTGTKLGDPIEIDGICNAFRKYTDKKQFCAIGAVKSNIGHLGECAGMASLLKVIMALQKGEIPPSLYFNRPNRKIDFEDSPVFLNTKLRKWKAEGAPKRCGVSSFGISGTNCHLILEEAPQLPVGQSSSPSFPRIFTLSAKSETALGDMIQNYRDFLAGRPGLEFADLCYNASSGRNHFNFRLAFIVKDLDDLETCLAGISPLQPESADGIKIFYGKHEITPDQNDTKETNRLSKEEHNQLNETVKAKVEKLIASGSCDEGLMQEICALYIQGAEVEWYKLFRENEVKKVSLPVYPFAADRCWIEIDKSKGNSSKSGAINQYYEIKWQAEAITDSTPEVNHREILVLKDARGIGAEIASKLRDAGKNVIEVELSGAYRKITNQSYTITGTAGDYERLLEDIKGRHLSQIIHLFSIAADPELKDISALAESQNRGVYSLYHLVRALIKVGMEDKIDLALISEYVTEVTENEARINPENASLLGLGKVVGEEYPEIACRGIDIDELTGSDDLLSELGRKNQTYQVAYRKGTRYVELFREAEFKRQSTEKTVVKPGGVYIITGGAGGIGLVMAKYLAGQNKVNLILINRASMPERETWDEVLNAAANPKLCQKILAIREIESTGSKVFYHSLDISKYDEVKTLFDGLRRQFGAINGIIHSAGVTGNAYIVRRSAEAFQEVLGPKIQGTWILDQVTKSDSLDFMALFSSGLSIMGEPGHGDYVAANSYLDSFAAYRNRQGKRTLTINWAAWKSVGTSVEYGVNVDRIFKAIPTGQALAGFAETLPSDSKRVIIAELNYGGEDILQLENPPFRLAVEIKSAILAHKAPSGVRQIVKRERPVGEVDLKGREKGGYSEIEKNLAKLYYEMLGFSEISIYDNFFELGGDSLLVNRMYRELGKLYPGMVKVADLFTYTSIFKLAQYIAAKFETGDQNIPVKPAKDLKNELTSIFDEMQNGQLTMEQVIAKVSKVGDK